jgi:hypothetical protein
MRGRTVRGKSIILALLVFLALWGAVLAALVWNAAQSPHHARVRNAGNESAGSGSPR